MRHLGDDRDVGVDPHRAEVQALGHAGGAAEVPRPHRRREPVLHAVGPLQRLRLVAELLDGDDRTEDLVLDHLVVLLEVGDDRRLEPVPAVVRRHVAARGDARVRRRALDEALDALALDLADDRAHVGVVVQRVAVDGALRLLGERIDEVPIDAGAGEHARGGRAVLAGVEVAGARDALGGGLDVGVVEHDDRGLAAELEVDALERVGGGGGDGLAGADRAGEGDEVDALVAHELLTDVALAEDDVEDAGGDVLVDELREPDGGGRRVLRRLEDHGVAGGDRGGELPDGHHERVVPRRDPAADPDRLAADRRRVAGHVLGARGALEDAGGGGHEADLVGGRRDLLADRQRERLAGVLGLDLRELLTALLQLVGDLQQREAALGRRGLTPLVEACARGRRRRRRGRRRSRSPSRR